MPVNLLGWLFTEGEKRKRKKTIFRQSVRHALCEATLRVSTDFKDSCFLSYKHFSVLMISPSSGESDLFPMKVIVDLVIVTQPPITHTLSLKATLDLTPDKTYAICDYVRNVG